MCRDILTLFLITTTQQQRAALGYVCYFSILWCLVFCWLSTEINLQTHLQINIFSINFVSSNTLSISQSTCENTFCSGNLFNDATQCMMVLGKHRCTYLPKMETAVMFQINSKGVFYNLFSVFFPYKNVNEPTTTKLKTISTYGGKQAGNERNKFIKQSFHVHVCSDLCCIW